MRSCSVLNCTNKSSKPSSVTKSISFHYFPKDPETRQAWIYATGRLNWTPQKHNTICSEHFTEYDFTMRNGKKCLRSTTVPRFNLNEQSSRYSESQYHNETQAALEFLTGQLYPENQLPEQQEEVVTMQDIDQLHIEQQEEVVTMQNIDQLHIEQQEEVVTMQNIDQLPIQQEAEVVTMQVIGGNNPMVVIRKPSIEPQTKPSPPEKKPKYFSIVNNFKSEAQLKAERDKIHELVRKNVDPEISNVLLMLGAPNVKTKSSNEDNTTKKPRSSITGQFIKTKKEPDERYADNLTPKQYIHKLEQKDLIISKQKLTIRELLKSQLRDKMLIESLEIRLNIKNNETAGEPTNELVVETPQYNQLGIPFMNKTQQQIATQKQQRKKTTHLENNYQTNGNFSDQDQMFFDTHNGHSKAGFKRPSPQQKVTKKRKKIETTNSENLNQTNMNFSNQDKEYFDTQNGHSKVGFKRPAPQQKVTKKRQRIETTNSETLYQSNRNFSDQDDVHFDTQIGHSKVGFKRPAPQQKVTKNTENHHQSRRSFSDQVHFDTQNGRSKVGFKRPAPQQNVIVHSNEILRPPSMENQNQPSMIFSEQDRRHFWQF